MTQALEKIKTFLSTKSRVIMFGMLVAFVTSMACTVMFDAVVALLAMPVVSALLFLITYRKPSLDDILAALTGWVPLFCITLVCL